MFHSYKLSLEDEPEELRLVLPNMHSMKPLHSLSIEQYPDSTIGLARSLQPLSLRSLAGFGYGHLLINYQFCNYSEISPAWSTSLGTPTMAPQILTWEICTSLRLEDAARNLFPSVQAPLLDQVVLSDFEGVIASSAPDFMFRLDQPHLPSLRRFAFRLNFEVSVSSIVNFIRSHPGLLQLDFLGEINSANLSSILDAITMTTLSSGARRKAQLKKMYFFSFRQHRNQGTD